MSFRTNIEQNSAVSEEGVESLWFVPGRKLGQYASMYPWKLVVEVYSFHKHPGKQSCFQKMKSYHNSRTENLKDNKKSVYISEF